MTARAAEKLTAGATVRAKRESGEMPRMRAYPQYKHSGVEWLGEIPIDWETVPVKGLYQRERRTNHTEKELLSVYRDYGVIPKSSRDDNNNKESDDLTPYQLVKVDDLVMNKMKAWQGSIAISEFEGIVSPAYYVYSPRTGCSKRVYPRYVHYLLRNPIYITQYMARSKGIRVNQWDLDPEAFEKVEVLLPSKNEQEKIYRFLDRETARIDNLIAEKQNFINLLKEKRQALISHVVTKGLDPQAKMKDSGIEWIGEVPEHWKVGALGFYSTLNTGATPDRKNEAYWGGGIPWIKTGEVRYNTITDTEEKITEEGFRNASVKLSPPGTVIMAMYGQGVTRGRVAILGIDATYNQACVAIHLSASVVNVFLTYVLMAAYNYIRNFGNETSQTNLNAELVSKIKIIVPPVYEQVAIHEYLDKELVKFNELETETEQSIELLKEHRTALISAAVTGKIDVRAPQ